MNPHGLVDAKEPLIEKEPNTDEHLFLCHLERLGVTFGPLALDLRDRFDDEVRNELFVVAHVKMRRLFRVVLVEAAFYAAEYLGFVSGLLDLENRLFGKRFERD